MAAGVVADASAAFLLRLVHDIFAVSVTAGVFKKDCTDLVRRIALFTHLLEEIRDFGPSENDHASSSSDSSWSDDLAIALQAAKRLLSAASVYQSVNSSDGAAKRISFQFQCVTSKLEKSLAKIPFDQFQISEEVQEQISLVRAQLRRATERYGSLNSSKVLNAISHPLEKGGDTNNHDILGKMDGVPENPGAVEETKVLERVNSSSTPSEAFLSNEIDSKRKENLATKGTDQTKKPDALVIPVDYLCPISLELMRDPVIVATGQTYERSYIQRWIDCGNVTCPKTQQKLENLTLTPNYI